MAMQKNAGYIYEYKAEGGRHLARINKMAVDFMALCPAVNIY
jgi:hypothetical protein